MMTDNSNVTTQTTPAPNNSTLIEFPGVNRNRPAWRKELSERFREIQQRRAREAELEAEAESRRRAAAQELAEEFDASPSASAEATKQLGLVPAPDEPEPNPIVVAALRRLERARQHSSPPATRAASTRTSAAAAAVARVVEEEAETEPLPAPAYKKRTAQPEAQAVEKSAAAEQTPALEQSRASSFIVVQTRTAEKPAPAASAPATVEAPARPAEPASTAPATKAETAPASQTETATTPAAETVAQESTAKPRHVAGVIDDHWLERREAEILPKVVAAEVTYDDRAPRTMRLAAALVDLIVVAFLCAPCAAVIELTIGDWTEPRVLASMGGIVAVMMFLYHTCSVALASRTFGMKLFGLHAVDAGTARVPTTWQCARRAFVYMLSLATFGLGLLYSLFDAEGRTAHDLLSGTVVVKE